MAGLDEFAKYVNDRQYEKSQRSKGKAKTGKQRKGKRERTWEPTFTANNPVARYYDPTDDHGIKAHFPTPDYSGDIKEAWLREHPPRAFHPASVSDPAYRRRQADAERRARERLGFTRADQLSVQRSVGVASLLNANLHAGPRRPHAAARAAAWAYPADLDADTSLRRDLHRISEELDAEDARAAAAAVVASVAADAAERRKLKNQRRRERGWTPDDDDDVDDKAHAKQDDDDDDMPTNEYQGKSARAIAGKLMMESVRNLCLDRSATALGLDQEREAAVLASAARSRRVALQAEEEVETTTLVEERHITQSLDALKRDIRGCQTKSSELLEGTSKQTAIEIEQLNARVVEAETKLKTEVTRIKKKMQMTITELEMSLDVANRNNLELQKTIKKQSIQLTELQAHYDETQRQLAVTLDQYGIAQRRLQSMTSELEEVRGNYESALRSKRSAEQLYEEAQSRINELTTINVNLAASRSKLEQELGTLAGDYEEATKELRVADERYQRVQVELKHTVEMLHEEQERVIKIETIKKSLEIEVKNLSVRLEEVEANAIVGGKRIISKLEARMRDLELELDEEKRRHAETIKILRKKERHVKEVLIQNEEDQKNIGLLQEMLDKATSKVNIYKRQLNEQEGMSQQSVTRVRRFQRELEAAEDRAENAESNLSLIRAKHRTFVTTSTVPGSQVYMVQETRSSSEAF